jgi:hypothetical protein
MTIQTITYVILYNDILQVNPFIILRSALFWGITQHILIPYRRFERTYRSQLQGQEIQDFLSLEVGDDFPETSVTN